MSYIHILYIYCIVLFKLRSLRSVIAKPCTIYTICNMQSYIIQLYTSKLGISNFSWGLKTRAPSWFFFNTKWRRLKWTGVITCDQLYCMYNSNLSLQCNFNLTVRVPVQVLRNEYTHMYSFNTYLGAIAILQICYTQYYTVLWGTGAVSYTFATPCIIVQIY